MANPHPFIIPILWICILCLLRCFAMPLLYMDLNSVYMHMLLFLGIGIAIHLNCL